MAFTGTGLDTNRQYFNMQVSLFLQFRGELVHIDQRGPDYLNLFGGSSSYPRINLKRIDLHPLHGHNLRRHKQRKRPTSNDLQLLDHFLSVGQLALHLILKII